MFDKYSSGVLSDEQYERLNLSVRERITQLRRMEGELTAAYLKDEAIEIDPVKLSSAMKQLLSEHSQDLQTTRQLLETLIDFVVVQGAGVRIHYRFNGNSSLQR